MAVRCAGLVATGGRHGSSLCVGWPSYMCMLRLHASVNGADSTPKMVREHPPPPPPPPPRIGAPSTTASTSGREKAPIRFPHFRPRPLSTSWERRSEESQPRRNHDTVPLPPPGKIRFLASVYRGPFSANSAGLLRSPGTASPRPPLSGPAVLLPVTLASLFPLRTDTFPLLSTCPQPHLLPLGAQPRETKAGQPRGRPGQPGPLPASSRFPF